MAFQNEFRCRKSVVFQWRYVSEVPIGDSSPLIQEKAWPRQAARLNLSQSWPSSQRNIYTRAPHWVLAKQIHNVWLIELATPKINGTSKQQSWQIAMSFCGRYPSGVITNVDVKKMNITSLYRLISTQNKKFSQDPDSVYDPSPKHKFAQWMIGPMIYSFHKMSLKQCPTNTTPGPVAYRLNILSHIR